MTGCPPRPRRPRRKRTPRRPRRLRGPSLPVGAIRNSVQIVKSGVGAFGILAAVCIVLPAAAECLLWSGACALGHAAAELFEAPAIGSLLEACGSVVKMVLAVLASVCAVCVASAAAVVALNNGG